MGAARRAAMSMTTEKTVRDLALEIPGATRVFEKLGIDYCCGGNRTLEEACEAAKQPLDRVLESLSATDGPVVERNWQMESLCELIVHIKNTHHQYVRAEIARLGPLFNKVCPVHGENHPELRS